MRQDEDLEGYRDPMEDGYDDYLGMDDPEADAAAQLLALVRDGAWLDAQDFPPTRWAVPGLIPEGFGLFTGAPKIGKSWCVLGIGLDVAGGTPALGRVDTGNGRPVLYLALEDGHRRLQWRARRLLAERPIPRNFHEVTDLTPAQVLPLMRAWLQRHDGERPLVMLDTLGKVMPASAPGESAYQRDYRVGSDLKRVIDAHQGATLLVVHHVRKVTGEDWMDSTSGTNGLNGAADFTVNLHRPRNDTRGRIRVTGRDVAENEYAVTVDEGAWHLEGDDLVDAARAAQEARATANLGEVATRVLEYVSGQDGPVTAKQVSSALDLARARDYLLRLVESERLVKLGRGLYGVRVASVASVATERSPDSGGLWRVEQQAMNATDATHDTATHRVPGSATTTSSVLCSTCSTPLHEDRAAFGKTLCRDCEAITREAS